GETQPYRTQAEYEKQAPGALHLDTSVVPRADLPPNAEPGYADVWLETSPLVSQKLTGLEPNELLKRCSELVAQGYRPAALSVASLAENKPLVTASIWHRPAVTEKQWAAEAQRQANVGAALLRLGRPERVWPLWRLSEDPSVRSRLIERV